MLNKNLIMVYFEDGTELQPLSVLIKKHHADYGTVMSRYYREDKPDRISLEFLTAKISRKRHQQVVYQFFVEGHEAEGPLSAKRAACLLGVHPKTLTLRHARHGQTHFKKGEFKEPAAPTVQKRKGDKIKTSGWVDTEEFAKKPFNINSVEWNPTPYERSLLALR